MISTHEQLAVRYAKRSAVVGVLYLEFEIPISGIKKRGHIKQPLIPNGEYDGSSRGIQDQEEYPRV